MRICVFVCLLAHVVAQRQQRARTGWERHQWCKPTFGSVGENVNSVYALTVFTYSTINSIPKAYSAGLPAWPRGGSHCGAAVARLLWAALTTRTAPPTAVAIVVRLHCTAARRRSRTNGAALRCAVRAPFVRSTVHERRSNSTDAQRCAGVLRVRVDVTAVRVVVGRAAPQLCAVLTRTVVQ